MIEMADILFGKLTREKSDIMTARLRNSRASTRIIAFENYYFFPRTFPSLMISYFRDELPLSRYELLRSIKRGLL